MNLLRRATLAASPRSLSTFCSRLSSASVFVVVSALASTGCLVRGESSELVLKGSIAESSEVVQLDPVFLSRQKKVEAQFFGFSDEQPVASADEVESDKVGAASQAADAGEGEIDLAVAPRSLAPVTETGRVQLRWPLQGNITSPFGMRHVKLHAGVDIKGQKGEPIYAAGEGQILSAKRRKGYGVVAIIGHDHDHQTLYAHMLRLAVAEGEFVKTGQLVGYVGRSGHATGYHLHFETRVAGGIPQDPLRYLPLVKGLKIGLATLPGLGRISNLY